MQSLANIGQNAASSVVSAIRDASVKSGVDFSYLMEKAAVESSFNPTAKASTSSASGLYQFINSTWLHEIAQHGAQYGLSQEAAAVSVDASGQASVGDAGMRQHILALKNDPTVAAEMAAEFTKDNKAALQSAVGGPIGGTELYLAHFLGAGGASKFLNGLKANPAQSAASLMPQAADANSSIFYHADGSARSVGEVYNRFAAKFDGNQVSVSRSSEASVTGGGGFSPFMSSGSVNVTQNTGDVSKVSGSGQERASLYEMLVLSQLSATEKAADPKPVTKSDGDKVGIDTSKLPLTNNAADQTVSL